MQGPRAKGGAEEMGTPSSAESVERLTRVLTRATEEFTRNEQNEQQVAELELTVLSELIAALKPILKYLVKTYKFTQFRGGSEGGTINNSVYALPIISPRRAEEYSCYEYELMLGDDGRLIVLRSIYVDSKKRRSYEHPWEYTAEKFLKENVPQPGLEPLFHQVQLTLRELFPVEEIVRVTTVAVEQVLETRQKQIASVERRVSLLHKIRETVDIWKQKLTNKS